MYMDHSNTCIQLYLSLYCMSGLKGVSCVNGRTPQSPEEVRTFSVLSTSSREWCPRTDHWRLAGGPSAHPPGDCRRQMGPPRGGRGCSLGAEVMYMYEREVTVR